MMLMGSSIWIEMGIWIHIYTLLLLLLLLDEERVESQVILAMLY